MHLTKIRRLPMLAAFGSLLLTSCGGGSDSGSGSAPTQPPAATGPRFTSSATTSIIENTADAFYTASATDAQGGTVNITVFSGQDADKFVIDGSGALRFNAPPNFDLPIDANGDNVYLVTLRATSAGGTADLNLRVTVTNDREGVAVRRIATGIVDPVDFSFVHNEPTLLIAEKSGRVIRFDPTDGSMVEDVFIRDNKMAGEVLAIAFAFPNRRNQEGTYLITHSDQDGLYLQGFDSNAGAKGFARLGNPWTSAGKASLIAQNELYIAIGDPGGNAAQDASSPYGKLLRVGLFDPYAGASLRPSSELIVGAEIIGDGIQNPGGFTPAADFLYLADQGSSVEHDLTIFRRDWRPLDFGWPFYEGSQAVRSNPPAAVNGPTFTYSVGNANKQGTGIIAGLLNDANFFEALGESYIFADANGTIWSVGRDKIADGFLHRANEFEVRNEDFMPDQGQIDSPVAFAPGFGSDHFYILDSDGEIFIVEEA